MRQNIQRTEQRGENLDHMEAKTTKIRDNSDIFARGTNRVRKEMKMKNIRMWVAIILILAVIILIVVLGMSNPSPRPAVLKLNAPAVVRFHK